MCVCSCVCVCVCVCPSSPPHNPAHAVGLNNRIPPTPVHDPSPPFPHPYPQAIARPTLGKNYPLKSARHLHGASGTNPRGGRGPEVGVSGRVSLCLFFSLPTLTLRSLLFSFSWLFSFAIFPCFFVCFSFLFQVFLRVRRRGGSLLFRGLLSF